MKTLLIDCGINVCVIGREGSVKLTSYELEWVHSPDFSKSKLEKRRLSLDVQFEYVA